MSKVMFVTYAGDCCYYESITEQDAHIGRIVKWLNDGLELSVLPFDLGNGQGSDILITVGECCHRDLFDCVASRDMSFVYGEQNFHVGGVFGGFCVKSKGSTDVVHTRDSEDYPCSNTGIVNIGQLVALHYMKHMLRMDNLDDNRRKRLSMSPKCKKPVLSFEEQLTKIQKWHDAYDEWDYSSKGGFPEIPGNILELAEASPKLDGYRPVVEINFYLSTIQEHLDFVFKVLWPLELNKTCKKYGSAIGAPTLKDGLEWPGKSVKVVGLDVEAYKEEEGTSAWKVRQAENDPIHVESFTHLLMYGVEYDGYIPIPGFNMRGLNSIDDGYQRNGYRVITNADGVALDSNEECLSGFIASRMF